uniref:Fibronectin type III domain-containing protein n=1 Tax=Streptomyces sp. NBC_01393 TaxID=2903851 RepID=A0AAU3HNR7_9ACTN
MRFSTRLITIGVAVSGLAGGLSDVAAAAEGTVVAGGILTQDTTWTAANGPYTVTTPMQIPDGVTLTIEPGTTVKGQGASALFRVLGTVRAAGTSEAPIVLDGGGGNIVDAKNSTSSTYVDVEHAEVRNAYSFWPATGYQQYGHFDLRDSSITNVTEYSYIWYPGQDVHIERNLFSNSGGFSNGGGGGSVYITDNRFATASTTGYWVRNWAAYGAPTQVHGNTFGAPGTPSVEVEANYTSAGLDATGNYWGTTDRSLINAMVTDRNDGLDYNQAIPIDPVLSAPTAATPAGPPSAPRNVFASPSVAPGYVTATWTEPLDNGGSDITSYTITPSCGGTPVSVPADQTTVTLNGMDGGAGCTFAVRARNTVGLSPNGTSNPVNLPTRPAAPTQLSVTPRDSNVDVSWIPGNDGGSPVTEWLVTAQPGDITATVPANTHSAKLTGLTNGTAYTVSVQARNAIGLSAPAVARPATPADITAPAAPTNVTANGSSNQATVSWKNPVDSDLTGVVVMERPGTTAPKSPTDGTAVYRGSGNSAHVTSLKAGSDYSFSVFAYDEVNNYSKPVVAHLSGTALTIKAGTSTVSYGSSITLTSTLISAPTTKVPGQPVLFYVRKKGSTTWTYLGTAKTNTAGTATWTHRPMWKAEYTARFAGSSGRLGAASSVASVTVKANVTADFKATTIRKGASTYLTGSVSPKHAGKKVTLQRYTSGKWVTAASATLSTTSSYRFSVKATSAGTFSYRVYFPGDTDHAASYSLTRKLTVK